MDQFYRFTPVSIVHKRNFAEKKPLHSFFSDCWIQPLPLDFLCKRVNMFSKGFFPSVQGKVSSPCLDIRLKKIPAYSFNLYAVLFVLQYLPGVWCEQWIWAEVWDISSKANSHSKQNKTKHSSVCVKCNSKFQYSMIEECTEELPLFLISGSSWRSPRRTLERALVLNTGCEFIINGILL